MVEEPSHIKQLSMNHVCKIGLKEGDGWLGREMGGNLEWWVAKQGVGWLSSVMSG